MAKFYDCVVHVFEKDMILEIQRFKVEAVNSGNARNKVMRKFLGIDIEVSVMEIRASRVLKDNDGRVCQFF
ncbi:hypothetical protein [Atlantibacter hermannii]|uniref:hypothetical protein n=1 Tax=Atlantibacter hermannii TaxID=565 RepID=UPI002FDF90BF